MYQKIKRWFGRPKNPSGHVYYAKLSAPQGVFYKLGYTGKSTLLERFAYGERGDETLIDREFFFSYRPDAWDVEQTLLDHFDKHRAFGKYSSDPSKPLHGRGQSELFVFDVLGLDEDLYKFTAVEREALSESVEKTKGGCLFIMIGLVLIPFTLGFSLFFLLGGFAEIFGETKAPRTKCNLKPTHPPKIQALIEELTWATAVESK